MNNHARCLALVTLVLVSLSPVMAFAERDFAEAYGAVFRGDLARTGNSVMTCDRANESNGRCNQIESTTGTPTFANNDTYTRWIDIDTDGGTFNSSSGTLTMTGGASVAWAGLYWNGNDRTTSQLTNTAPLPQNQVLMQVPNTTTYVTVTADWCSDIGDRYQCFADVSGIVSESGTYVVANVSANTGQDDYVGGWELAVAYRDIALPLRSISVWDGHKQYANGNSQTILFNGFLTPLSGPINAIATLSVAEGDAGSGDNATFQSENSAAATTLSTDLGNGSISNAAGNITSRNPAYRNTLGLDIDIFDVSALMVNGDTEATVDLPATPGEVNEIYKVDFATDVYFPSIVHEKAVTDLNGNDVVPGDTLRYTVTVENENGVFDDAVNLVITDALPVGVTYVANSLVLTESTPMGPAVGAISDTAGNDVGEYDSNTRTVTMRLGNGATSSAGGLLAVGESVTFEFEVTIDSTGTPVNIANEAVASYEGETLATGGVVRVNDTPSNDPDTTPYEPTQVIVYPDLDGDGLGDASDLDTDNDGILDIDEGNGTDPSLDSDGDLIPDWQDPDTLGWLDVNNDNVDDRYDFDFDGIPNHIDLDSDGDGLFDIAETTGAAFDANNDGRVDNTSDADGDGLLDPVDPTTTGGVASILTNTDTTDGPDFLDDDDDGDGITTATEIADGAVHGNNPDNDANPNWYDTDSDGDGIDDDSETDDADVDGIPDYLDAVMSLILNPGDGTATSDNLQAISGATEANAALTMRFRNAMGTVVGTATGNASSLGLFSLQPTMALPDGTYTVELDVVDSTGNTASDSIGIVVDTTAGVLIVTTPADASIVSAVTVSGSAEPGATVTIVFDQGTGSAVTVTTTADATTGAYSATPPAPLTEGAHTVTVTATDQANNTAGPETRIFGIDRTAPSVTIATPASGATVSSSTLTGTTEPGASVSLVFDAGTGAEQTVVVVADTNGNWTASPTLTEGAHTVAATATDVAGNVGSATNSTFTLDSTAPATLTAVLSNGQTTGTVSNATISGNTEPGATVTLVFDAGTANEQTKVVTADANGDYSATPDTPLADGQHTVDVSAADATGNTIGPVSLAFGTDTVPPAVTLDSPADGDAVGTLPTIAGTAEAGASVDVTIDAGTANEVVISTVADGNGNWSVTAATALSGGAHTVRADATDAAGNTSGIGPVNFTVSGASLTLAEPVDGSITNDATPALVGTADVGAVVTIVLDAGTADEQTLTVNANANGDWFVFSPALTDGVHTVDVSVDDGLGGTLNRNASFTVDTTGPAIAITEPTNGSATTDTTPRFSGTTDNDLIVDLYIDGTFVDTAPANAVGDWTYTVPDGDALADGLYELEVRATDAAGNQASATVTFTVDTVAPGLTIDGPPNASTTSSATPAITGTTEPNAMIEVSIDGNVVGTAMANASGFWTFTPATALAEGAHNVEGVATDAAGNASPVVASSFTVDTTLAFIAISEPAEGSVTRETMPTIIGTADPNASVEIAIDGTVVATVTADGNGDWSHIPATDLTEGVHTVTATVTENNQASVASSRFTVDTTPPVLTVDTPMSGLINDATPTISGTTEANATVVITLPDGTTDQVVADGNGDWSYVPSSPQPEGDGQITAYAQDAAGNNTTVVVDITIDITPPNVSITNPDDNATKNDPSLEYRGTADANEDVELYLDGNLLTTVTADANGDWTYTDANLLQDGVHNLEARATDAAGNTATDSVDFIIDTRGPSLAISAPTEGQNLADGMFTISGTSDANQAVEVFIDGVKVGDATADANGDWTFDATGVADGNHVVFVQADDGNGNIANDEINIVVGNPGGLAITNPTDGGIVNTATPTISGTAAPGATIEVFVDDVSVGTTTVDASGAWSLATTTALAEGAHTVRATDGTGSVSADFTVNTANMGDLTITYPTDGGATNDDEVVIRGTGTPGTTIEVFVDGVKVGETTVDNNGDWEYTPTGALSEGEHTVEVTTTKPDGTVQSVEVTFDVDLTPPTGEITTPTDGDETSDQPPISGEAEPGTTVEVFVDGVKIGETQPDGDGYWTLTPAQPLADGEHTVTVTITDPAGNTTDLGPITFISNSDLDNVEDGLLIVGGRASCSASATHPSSLWPGIFILIGLVLVGRRRRDHY